MYQKKQKIIYNRKHFEIETKEKQTLPTKNRRVAINHIYPAIDLQEHPRLNPALPPLKT
jgi:hypothetical protein